MAKLKLSGHESFHCRQFWLKKGYDFLDSGHKYTDKQAVVRLGVGKNMVASIRFWLESFGVTEEYELSEFGKKIFSDNGFDPYLEDRGTLWLLHYQLVSTRFASLYSVVFNQFRKQRIEFTSEHIKHFLTSAFDEKLNNSTVERDIKVFFKNYLKPKKSTNSIEDDFSVLFHELNLINQLDKDDTGRKQYYKIESNNREDIPNEIILFAILSNPNYSQSISFFELLNGENSVGNIFALNSDGLYNKLQEITEQYTYITFKEDAGTKTIQLKEQPNQWAILEQYYAK